MRFDLVDLRLFLAVVEGGSITEGARRVHLALASASQRVRAMEDSLGVALLERRRHGVRPTPAGQTLAEEARSLLAQVSRLQGELAAFGRGERGVVRLMANTAAFSEHLPARLAAFLAETPGIDLDVEESESEAIAAAVASGRVDLGIARAEAIPPELASEPFGLDRLVLLTPPDHPLAAEPGVRFQALLGEQFVGLSRVSALQRHLDERAARLGRPLRIRVRAMAFDAVAALVAAGAGVAIVPEAAAERWAAPGGRAPPSRVRLTDAWAERRLMLCYGDPARLSPPAQRLLARLRASAIRSGG